MKTKIFTVIVAIALSTITNVVNAATIVNSDGKAYTLMLTESGQQSEIGIGPGESKQLCAGGCFLTFPNGDREALNGTETIEIKDGKASFR